MVGLFSLYITLYSNQTSGDSAHGWFKRTPEICARVITPPRRVLRRWGGAPSCIYLYIPTFYLIRLPFSLWRGFCRPQCLHTECLASSDRGARFRHNYTKVFPNPADLLAPKCDRSIAVLFINAGWCLCETLCGDISKYTYLSDLAYLHTSPRDNDSTHTIPTVTYGSVIVLNPSRKSLISVDHAGVDDLQVQDAVTSASLTCTGNVSVRGRNKNTDL